MFSLQTSFPKDSSSSGLHENNTGITYHLEVVQNPTRARATGWGSKADARRPVDPPPVLKFEIRDSEGKRITHESRSMFIVHTSLLSVDGNIPSNDTNEGIPAPSRLAGTTITSLTHVRNPLPGKFLFIFNDLSIRQEGQYKLKFRMYEVLSDQGIVRFRTETVSSVITAYSPKNFPGLATSSDLIKEIAQQGHKVRVRKESTLNRRRKRGAFEIPQSLPVTDSTFNVVHSNAKPRDARVSESSKDANIHNIDSGLNHDKYSTSPSSISPELGHKNISESPIFNKDTHNYLTLGNQTSSPINFEDNAQCSSGSLIGSNPESSSIISKHFTSVPPTQIQNEVNMMKLIPIRDEWQEMTG